MPDERKSDELVSGLLIKPEGLAHLRKETGQPIFTEGRNWQTDANRRKLYSAVAVRFQQIILNAPKLKEPARVWRVLAPHKKNSNSYDLYKMNGFISTNIVENCNGNFDEQHPALCAINYLAVGSVQESKPCCIVCLTIEPNTPCLFLAPISVGAVLEVVLLNTENNCNISLKSRHIWRDIYGPLTKYGKEQNVETFLYHFSHSV